VAAEQTILFTVTPRAISVDGDTLPISVVVTPRLRGADRLDAFPDWQLWTRRLREDGLVLTIRCGGDTVELPIDQGPLNPELWEALFKADTLVRPHVFDDYSDREVISYPVRETLSALKSVYQEAAVQLALPAGPDGDSKERGPRNRRILRNLVDGLEMHWNPDLAERWRTVVRARGQPRFAGQSRIAAQLDGEGLIVAPPSRDAKRAVALPFSVFHHMPTPPYGEDGLQSPDWDTALDFHQALGSLDSYPTLQRALGLVFDLELPRELVPLSTSAAVETLSVAEIAPGWDWSVPPETPALETASLHVRLPDGRHIFLAAPRELVDASAPSEAVGLLNLDPLRFGLAQVDVDGGMHKAMILAETWHEPDPERNLVRWVQPEPAPHPEVFDPGATLPALRSGGLTLFADRRAQHLLDTVHQSKAFNSALESGGTQPRPFCAEDLLRGYRLDVWDSETREWHSLHLRTEAYHAEDVEEGAPEPREGFVQLAVTEPAEGSEPQTKDLYLHEAIARWAGWSLSVPMPGRHLSHHADPDKALPGEGDDPAAGSEPVTPFKLRPTFGLVAGSLPRLRFGTRYRIRARTVDLAGNSLSLGDPLADQLAAQWALPRDADGFPYLRFEPVPAPLVVVRDADAVTGPGSAVDRLVIRTFNGGVDGDEAAADTTAADRHVLPPRTSVELGERLRMFDDASGKLKSDAATWKLIGERDAGEVAHITLDVAGKESEMPLEPAEQIDALPYLPDPLARGAAIRDLPGTPFGAVGRVGSDGGAADVDYEALADPSPRPGSATIVEFAGAENWEELTGFRLVLAEPPAAGQSSPPHWNAAERVLTVFLPKGTMTTVPLTSFVRAADLTVLGQWQWLRQHIDRRAVTSPEVERLSVGGGVDEIAHVLQRAVEGGHWLLTPPRLLTLVHAVEQPLGRPSFRAIDLEHDPASSKWEKDPLQTKPTAGPADPVELAPVRAWRRPGSTDAYLIGALGIHGASTARVDLVATWDDPVDDLAQSKWTSVRQRGPVDELPLPEPTEGYLVASGQERRLVGYYDPEHEQIAFVRQGESIGPPGRSLVFAGAAPRHLLNDTKFHRVTYTAVATSRYREYFPQGEDADFTRRSPPIEVEVPASGRPLAPSVAYVLPTFGWQRQVDTNLMRSVRFGGGLRVYLDRPWFSSGDGELLGVALWSHANGQLDRETFKPYVTQWGMDPIWRTAELDWVPSASDFPDAASFDSAVTLEESAARRGREPGRVDVVGFRPEYDEGRALWFADLTVNTPNPTYMPFVRLALVRYQPNALLDAKISRVVLADFAQLTPDRTATVTFDPYRPRRLRIAVSGVAPRGPSPGRGLYPTFVRVRVQQRVEGVETDLGWEDAPATVTSVTAESEGSAPGQPDLALWAGTATFAEDLIPGRFRLLIEEFERIGGADREAHRTAQPGRLVYAETFELDAPSL
jgi:hypothetical protein